MSPWPRLLPPAARFLISEGHETESFPTTRRNHTQGIHMHPNPLLQLLCRNLGSLGPALPIAQGCLHERRTKIFRLLVLLAQNGLGWVVASSFSVGLLSTQFFYFLFHTLRKGIAGMIHTESMERLETKMRGASCFYHVQMPKSNKAHITCFAQMWGPHFSELRILWAVSM